MRTALAVLAAAAIAASPAAAAPAMSRSERAVVARVNDVRASHGLPRVAPGRALNGAADAHSADMAAHGFFAHESSDGTPFADRLRRFTDARMVGENLAALSPRAGLAAAIVQLWMDSPGHRAIILTAGFRQIGVATRTGRLDGARMRLVTADFSSRR